MKLALGLSVVIALSLFATVSTFAVEIARYEHNGRIIVIDSDGTWKYANKSSPTANACDGGTVKKSKKLNLTICVKPPWKFAGTPSEDFEFQIQDNINELYVGVITERSPLSNEALEYAIKSNAASASGVSIDDVPVLKKSEVVLNGMTWNYIEFDIDFKGAKFRFGNYYISLGETGVAQVAFWCSQSYFDQNRSRMEQFASEIAVTADRLQ